MRHTKRTILSSLFLLSTACGGFRQTMNRGEVYLERGNASAAIRTFENALEIRPGDPRAELGMARALIVAGEPGGAIDLARRATDADVSGAPAVLAMAILENGLGAEALPVVEEALQTDPENARLHMLQAEAYMSLGNLDRATSAAERALELGGGAVANSLAGWIHARNDNCDRARALARRASSTHFDGPRVQAEAAAIFRLCGEGNAMLTTATTARALLHDDGEAWIDSATRRGNGADQEGALRRLSWVRAIFHDDALLTRELGLLWLHLGHVDRALVELHNALELPPLNIESSVSGIRVADRRAEQLNADERREAVLEVWDAITDIHRSLNDVEGVAEAMESHLSERLDRAPEDYIVVSQAWERAGNYERAIEICLRAIQLDNDHIGANTQLARMYIEAGDLETATGYARLAFDEDTESADLAVLLGELYLAQNNRREARRVFGIGNGYNPDDPRIQDGLRRARGYGR